MMTAWDMWQQAYREAEGRLQYWRNAAVKARSKAEAERCERAARTWEQQSNRLAARLENMDKKG
jgi:hypothetical protein